MPGTAGVKSLVGAFENIRIGHNILQGSLGSAAGRRSGKHFGTAQCIAREPGQELRSGALSESPEGRLLNLKLFFNNFIENHIEI